MEILTNIWSALTTENKLLIDVLISIASFVENYLAFKLFSTIFKIEYSKTQKYAYIILSSICFLITNLFIQAPFNIFINYIVIFILVYKLFKLNLVHCLLAIILPQLLFGLIGTLIINPLLNIFDITSIQLSTIPIYRFTYLLISYLLFFTITYIMKFKNVVIKFIFDLDKEQRKIFLLNLSLGFIVLCTQIFLTYYYVSFVSIFMTFLNFISLFAYFFINFYSLTRVMKLQKTERELENAEAYNETLQVLYDNVKSFKHDFDNMIHMLDGYLAHDDMKGLKKYYYDLTKDYDRVNAISVLDPNVINNAGIYNLLIKKYKLATKLGVKLHIEFFMDFNNLHMPIYEFSRILGILLDNSIEAAAESNEKVVNIMFRASYRNDVEIVQIENTYLNKDIDINGIFNKEHSSKDNHMGMGLWEVKQIINRYNHIKLVTTKDDKYFKQQLEIYY